MYLNLDTVGLEPTLRVCKTGVFPKLKLRAQSLPRDLNPDLKKDQILSLTRLPIPPERDKDT